LPGKARRGVILPVSDGEAIDLWTRKPGRRRDGIRQHRPCQIESHRLVGARTETEANALSVVRCCENIAKLCPHIGGASAAQRYRGAVRSHQTKRRIVGAKRNGFTTGC
jgi:hypothetical protein